VAGVRDHADVLAELFVCHAHEPVADINPQHVGGAAAREFVSANRGAAEATAVEVLPLLTGSPLSSGAAR
jgi:hypothetical protein